MESVLAIQKQEFSLGDCIAHMTPLSSLEGINRAMSILVGEPFLARVRKTVLIPEHASEGQETFERFADDIYRELDALFRARHILCHELVSPEQAFAGDPESALGSVGCSSLLLHRCVGELLLSSGHLAKEFTLTDEEMAYFSRPIPKRVKRNRKKLH
jgi:hypothetical protein